MRTTGLGSMPGRDFRAATRVVAEVSEAVLAMPEVPLRDASSAIIGRTLGLLAQPCELDATGWRLAAGSGAAQQRAARWWRTDLDDFEELSHGHGGTVKVALAGPWTLAAAVRLGHPTMNHVITDPGACRDVWQALAEAATELAARLTGRLNRPVILQVDEPMIGAALGGELATFSGLDRYRTPDTDEVLTGWRELVHSVQQVPGVEQVWLHSCAPGVDIDLAGRAGFGGLALPAEFVCDAPMIDQCHGWLDAGRTLALGVARTDQADLATVDQLVTQAMKALRPLEPTAPQLTDQFVLTPDCGLAGWPMRSAGLLLERLAEAARLVAERAAT